jgi:hypothetical protein
MNHTRGALCGGKCGDRGRGGFDVDGAALVMMGREVCHQTLRRLIRYMRDGRVCIRVDGLRGRQLER